MRWTAAVVVGLGFSIAVPSSALAVGGPLAASQGASVTTPGSRLGYVAAPAGDRHTFVYAVDNGVAGLRSRIRLSGRYGIPRADYSGSMTGLSADGRTLVLEPMRPIAPARTTRLLVLGTRPFVLRRVIVLHGFETVDAVSPTGRWLYLIDYLSANFARYEVRAYDVVTGRLLKRPIVDPDDRGEAMEGFAINRVMSPGGRWAYTFYGRPSGAPFVHALDTVSVRAVCVDLPSLAHADFGDAQLRLGPGARTLQVVIRGTVHAVIDTRTLRVMTGAGVRPASRPAADDTASGPPWELAAAIPALAALAFATWRFRRRASGRRPLPQ